MDIRRKKGLKIFRFDRRLKDNNEVKLFIKEVWEVDFYLSVEERLISCRKVICRWSREF